MSGAIEWKNGNGKRRWQPQRENGEALYVWIGPNGWQNEDWIVPGDDTVRHDPKFYRLKSTAKCKAERYENMIRETTWSDGT